MPGAERYSNQVFKCLAYVDTMRVMNTKMLADNQRKLLDLKLFTNSHLFWGNALLLKMPGNQTKWYPIEKANTQLNKIANWLESLSVSLLIDLFMRMLTSLNFTMVFMRPYLSFYLIQTYETLFSCLNVIQHTGSHLDALYCF